MGILDNLVPALAAKFRIPQKAAQGAIACIVKAHQGDPASKANIQRAAQSPDPFLRNVLGEAYSVLRRHPAFWTAHYAAKARERPLHPSHPYAVHIAEALARIGAPALPRVMSAGSDYVLLDEERMDAAESPGIYGGPEYAPNWQKGGN